MRKAKVYYYKTPLSSVKIMRKNKAATRSGFWLQLQDDSSANKIGYGEVAPLPGFSKETEIQAKQQLLSYLSNWAKGEDLDLDSEDTLASVACGVSFAIGHLSGGLNFNEATDSDNSNFKLKRVCLGTTKYFDVFVDDLKRTKSKNAKLKLGFLRSDKEARLINQLFNNDDLQQIDNFTLRLDVNRNWNLADANLFLNHINKDFCSQIEFIEEPCKSIVDSLLFAQNGYISVAFDETVQRKNYEFYPHDGLSTIIIKPMLIGSINRCYQLINQAKQHDVTSVISSSFESPLGIALLEQFTKLYAHDSHAGLDTLKMFVNVELHKPFLLPFDSSNNFNNGFSNNITSGIYNLVNNQLTNESSIDFELIAEF